METGCLSPGLSALPTLWAVQAAPQPPESQGPHLLLVAELKGWDWGRAKVAAPLWLTRPLVNLTQAAMDVNSNL